MPSKDLLLNFSKDMSIDDQWSVNGVHYSRTLEDWLKKQDQAESQVRKVFRETYGEGQETKWVVRWRLFYLACSELFKWDNGNEWFVQHYRFVKK